MNVNVLSIEETINKVVKELNQLKERNDIESIEINIRKHWLDDKYDTEFDVNYNIGEVE